MKESIYILLLLMICSCSNNSNSNQQQEEQTEKTQEVSTLALDSLNNKLDSLYQEGIFNGFAVAVVDENGAIYNQGFGYSDVKTKEKYDENTIINIASISKMFIGIALLKAKELKLLDLDDPINKYLPFEVKNPNHPDEIISIRQLATHTSSIKDNDSYMKYCYVNKDDIPLDKKLKERYEFYYANSSDKWIELEDFLEKMLRPDSEWYDESVFDQSKPGEQYDYSNIGASLCALIVERAAKTPFSEFTKKHIFKPLGMSSTGWFFEDIDMSRHSKLYRDEMELPYYRNLSYPDGALITSSSDLSLFLMELIKGHSQNGALLSSESYKELFKSQLTKEQLKEKENFNAGLFSEKYLSYNEIGHSGGDPGTNTLMFFDSEKKVGRIMILNSDSDKENSMKAYWGIWNALTAYQLKVE